MTYEHLRYEQDDRVVVLTYDRPEQRNAISRAMNLELHDAWQRFRDDDDAFVLVITGSGDAFCAGWDLQDAADWPTPVWDEFRRDLHKMPGACGYTRRVDVFKPVIAAVNGWAVAAGLETALLADIRIVAANAVFGALERRWNIVAGDGMTVRLPLAVGFAKAMELIITGRAVDAEEALRIGLVDRVVPAEELHEAAYALAAELAKGALVAQGLAKRAIDAGPEGTLDDGLRLEQDLFAEVFTTEDSRTGVASFLEQGPGKATFQGR
jgi:enoyl-CoA hydratase